MGRLLLSRISGVADEERGDPLFVEFSPSDAQNHRLKVLLGRRDFLAIQHQEEQRCHRSHSLAPVNEGMILRNVEQLGGEPRLTWESNLKTVGSL